MTLCRTHLQDTIEALKREIVRNPKSDEYRRALKGTEARLTIAKQILARAAQRDAAAMTSALKSNPQLADELPQTHSLPPLTSPKHGGGPWPGECRAFFPREVTKAA
jgi:hypothetical protein